MNRTTALASTLTALGVLLSTAACDRGEPGEVAPPSGPVDVEVASPVEAAGVTGYAASVVSTDEAELATRTSGSVRAVRVDVGSVVERGDTLVELDATDVEAVVAAARAGLTQAERRFERMRNLAADGAATEQELDDARAALETARARLQEALAQGKYVVLQAPFSGVVTSRSVDPGDLAVPGRPVLSMVRPGSLEVVADLPAGPAATLAEGDRLSVADPDGDARHAVTVTRISPAVESASRRARVELRFRDPARVRITPGSYVRLEISDRDRPTTWIPADAVVRRGQLTGLFVVRDDRLELRWIRTGERTLEAIEVLAGVEPSDRVVRRPGPSLVDGTPVGAVAESAWSPAPGSER